MFVPPYDANHLPSRVVVDSCLLDMLVLDEDGHTLRRPTIDLWMDPDTRLIVGWGHHKPSE
jgi:hypothetical protein